jgi:hypothetical protein
VAGEMYDECGDAARRNEVTCAWLRTCEILVFFSDFAVDVADVPDTEQYTNADRSSYVDVYDPKDHVVMFVISQP